MLETKHTQLKNSGIAWIGSIPNDWILKKIDYMSTSYSGGTPDRDNYSYWENGTVNWMSSGEVNKRLVYDTYEKISLKGLRNSSAKLYPENTVMFALNGQGKTKGMTAILKTISSGNQSLVGFICDEKELHYRFLDYCFQASYKFNRSYYGGGDNRDGVAASNIKKMKIPVPSYHEQICLCDFLDSKINELDNIINKARRSLELLQEIRESIIFEAVTKGLDKGAEMKDSDIEWMGEIPEKWKMMKLRYLVNIGTEKGSISENMNYVGLENISSRTGKYIRTESEVDDLSNNKFYKGNILFGKLRPYLKKIWQADFDGVASSEFIIFKDSKMLMRYLYWTLFSDNFLENVDSSTYGTKMPRASWEYIKNILVTIPPEKEQAEIVNYLDSTIAGNDKMFSELNQIIDIAEQTKKSIIFEYVTGKKRVQV